jgi:pyruvate,water dikinase
MLKRRTTVLQKKCLTKEQSKLPENRHIRKIIDIEKPETHLYGSKACNLARLSRMGLKVPNAFVIDTETFDYVAEANGWSDTIDRILCEHEQWDSSQLQQASADIRSEMMKGELPSKIQSTIITMLEEIGGDTLVVRSSATAEDLPDASFAGQYDTFLNLTTDDEVIQKIVACYASLWTPRAITYREELGIPHDKIKLAVIIQNQVDAKSAGVLFTRDPVSPFHDYAVIESCAGLGESVVSGDVTPDRFYISREARGKTTDFKIIKKELNGYDLSSFSKPKSSRNELTQSISEQQAKQIAAIGDRIDREFGIYQDVEWAIDEQGSIHILQTRPITTMTIAEDDTYWTRGYADDYWNDNVTPLFFDLLGDQLTYIVNNELNAIMGYEQMSSELLRFHRAHAYFNLDVLKRKVINEIPPFLRSEDVLNYFPEGTGVYGKDTMKNLPFNLKSRLMAEIRVMLFDGQGSMTKTADAYQEWNDGVFVPYCEDFDQKLNALRMEGSDEELIDLADELDKVMIDHFRLVRHGIPVHNIGMNLMSSYLLRRFLGEDRASKVYPILISGLDHKTSETNTALHQLAESASKKPLVKRIILESEASIVLNNLRHDESEDSRQFLREFDDFIDRYGVRGFTREPYYPRWKEDSGLVFNVMKSLLRGESRITGRNRNSIQIQRQRVEKDVQRSILNQRFGRIKWILFSTILGFARRYICFREDQRFNLDRWITRNRELFLELGRRFMQIGVLERPSDIFFLRRREIRKIIRGEMDSEAISQLHSVMLERRNDFKENEDSTPPKFLVGNSEYDDIEVDIDEGVLRGIPASQGKVTGTIRVLHSIHEISEVLEGEILVVPKTDPGWTPVFAKIGGLITETGGILSHGAVVSREYGIPAITNIRRACETFQTGQKVSINGTKGYVHIH